MKISALICFLIFFVNVATAGGDTVCMIKLNTKECLNCYQNISFVDQINPNMKRIIVVKEKDKKFASSFLRQYLSKPFQVVASDSFYNKLTYNDLSYCILNIGSYKYEILIKDLSPQVVNDINLKLQKSYFDWSDIVLPDSLSSRLTLFLSNNNFYISDYLLATTYRCDINTHKFVEEDIFNIYKKELYFEIFNNKNVLPELENHPFVKQIDLVTDIQILGISLNSKSVYFYAGLLYVKSGEQIAIAPQYAIYKMSESGPPVLIVKIPEKYNTILNSLAFNVIDDSTFYFGILPDTKYNSGFVKVTITNKNLIVSEVFGDNFITRKDENIVENYIVRYPYCISTVSKYLTNLENNKTVKISNSINSPIQDVIIINGFICYLEFDYSNSDLKFYYFKVENPKLIKSLNLNIEIQEPKSNFQFIDHQKVIFVNKNNVLQILNLPNINNSGN